VLQEAVPVTDERRLVELFRAGDPRAFEQVVNRHGRAVYLAARRLLTRHEDADEAVQIAFVRAFHSREGFRGEASLRTWLIRIVFNVAKTMRGAQRETEDPAVLERLPDASEPADELVRRHELRRRVLKSIESLPPRQRETVMLKVLSELTYREVADVMQLSEGAVKAHLHQAVANLRSWFARNHHEE
jgi:RNA polymerase sigma-70 factor (ECF subfamily)